MMKLYDVIRKEGMTRERQTPEPDSLAAPAHIFHSNKRRRVTFKSALILLGVGLFFVVLYVVGIKVARANVTINERRIPFSLDGVEFELTKDDGTVDGRLSFQTMIVTTEVTREVYGSQVEPSTSTARGNIVFFNEYSTKPQTIKAKTALIGANKKKYQTTKAVTVPGYVIKNKAKVAGTSVSVPVVALDIGPSYNTTGTSFTISGYTGTRAKQLYAQSVGAIAGGDEGISHSVGALDEEGVVRTLQAQLIERLKRETRAQLPDDFIAYPELQVVTIDNNSLQLKGDSIKFPARMKGTMVTYLIPRKVLEVALVNHIRPDHAYPTVSIPTIANLTVATVRGLPADPNNVPDTIQITVTGDGIIITKAPLEAIRQSLLGTPKRDFVRHIDKVPEVESAVYHLYPFWAPYFPLRPTRITIDLK